MVTRFFVCGAVLLFSTSSAYSAPKVSVQEVKVESCAKVDLKVASAEGCFTLDVKKLQDDKWQVHIVGGVTVVAEAKVKSLKWQFGDGKFKCEMNLTVEDVKTADDAIAAAEKELPGQLKPMLDKFTKIDGTKPEKVAPLKIKQDKSCAELIRDAK
jgi:hypothetical protein